MVVTATRAALRLLHMSVLYTDRMCGLAWSHSIRFKLMQSSASDDCGTLALLLLFHSQGNSRLGANVSSASLQRPLCTVPLICIVIVFTH